MWAEASKDRYGENSLNLRFRPCKFLQKIKIREIFKISRIFYICYKKIVIILLLFATTHESVFHLSAARLFQQQPSPRQPSIMKDFVLSVKQPKALR